ncbi:MAG TPA: hypothetical protein VLL54_13380 [Pyrinomonadaceae bacterium]|nr:hypothetical protein [Pyrinomonadaceae bacterium]
MKVLVIAALLALLLLLVYSRIYPYLQVLRKIFGVAKTIATPPTDRGVRSTAKTEGKLVRCEGCGTWIPADRAIGFNSGRTVYCSRECIESSSAENERKIAG